MRKSLRPPEALPAQGLGKRHVPSAIHNNTAKPQVTLRLGISIKRGLLMHHGCRKEQPYPF